MDGGQSGGTFGTVIMNNNIHCDYANCHITSTAASHCLRQAFRSFVMVHSNRVASHLSAGSYMYYDARSFAGPSSVMILHSMAPSAQLNYDACSSTAPRPMTSALILRRDTETFLTWEERRLKFTLQIAKNFRICLRSGSCHKIVKLSLCTINTLFWTCEKLRNPNVQKGSGLLLLA